MTVVVSAFRRTRDVVSAFRRTLFVGVMVIASAAGVSSQSSGPQPTPMPPPIAAPKDVRYPGTIRLSVDARDVQRRIFSVHETMPVAPGQPLVLLFPQWLPGSHSPTGRVDKLAGLTIRANGTRLEWRRDVVDVFAFHVDVPPAFDLVNSTLASPPTTPLIVFTIVPVVCVLKRVVVAAPACTTAMSPLNVLL